MEFVAHLCASTLHFGPRSGENLFKGGFKMEVKKWKPRGPHNKAKVLTRRDRIKAAFKANGMPIFEARNNGAGVRYSYSIQMAI